MMHDLLRVIDGVSAGLGVGAAAAVVAVAEAAGGGGILYYDAWNSGMGTP
jgi:hypothetical protein